MQPNRFKQHFKAIFGDLSYYFESLKGDEADFWRSPSPISLWASAKAWPTGPGRWYLIKVIFFRLVIPLTIYLTTAFLVIIAGLVAWVILIGRV